MSDPSLFLQKAIRMCLAGDAGVTALVPAASIFDKNSLPEKFPCIILGEDQIVDEAFDLKRSIVRVYSTLHVWAREPGLVEAKKIAGAIRRAVRRGRFIAPSDGDFTCCDLQISGMRFVRDRDGESSHGIITIESLVQEDWTSEVAWP